MWWERCETWWTAGSSWWCEGDRTELEAFRRAIQDSEVAGLIRDEEVGLGAGDRGISRFLNG